MNRANRDGGRTRLGAAVDADPGTTETVEPRVRGGRPKSWAKSPGTPLGEVLAARR